MKKLSISCVLLCVLVMVGCEKKAPTPTKTEARTIVIGGVPVYEKDYQLTTRENSIDLLDEK